jgi:EthD domain-containing protein
MIEQTHWRLALMFDASDGDLARLEAAMQEAGEAIRAPVGAHGVRMGIADRHPDLVAPDDSFARMAHWRLVDGALEVTLVNDQARALPAIGRELRAVLAERLDLARLEVMAGPIFPMVPTRRGNAFLSLAFRRYPGTTSQQFQQWWLQQHSRIATPVLEPELLAYEQVHVEPELSQALAEAFGVPYVDYDAYDNLTWADRWAFLKSCTKDLEGMERIAADEVGRIDDTSRRHSLMREIG